MSLSPFHLAIPVHDLAAAEAFYCGTLGCSLGRTDTRWIDVDFFGHQVTAHLIDGPEGGAPTNPVDGDHVPVRHFGVVLPWPAWVALHKRLSAQGVPFRVEPRVRFVGQPGEQGTFFVVDPSGNALEFKSFQDPSRLFAT